MKKENFRDGIDEMDENEKKRKKTPTASKSSNRNLKNKEKESLETDLTKWANSENYPISEYRSD